MQVRELDTTTIRIEGIKGLDPVVAFLYQKQEGQDWKGYLTVTCFGQAWTCYWSSMGMPIRDFILKYSEAYIVNSLFQGYRGVAMKSKEDKQLQYLNKIVKALQTGLLALEFQHEELPVAG